MFSFEMRARGRVCECLRLIPVLIASFVVWIVCPSARADSYTVGGAVVVQTLDRAGTIQHNFRAPFKVVAGDGSWQIRIQYGTAYSETCGFDGKEFRSILDFNSSEFPPEATRNGNKVATMTMSDYPFHSEPTTRFVWLALCPDPNLVVDGKFIPAVWSMPFQNVSRLNLGTSHTIWLDETRARLKQTDFVQRNAGPAFLRSNVFLTAKTSDEEIKHSFDGMRDGGIVATYRVAATTNWAGRVFPLTFEMVVLADVDGGAPFPTQKYLGTVETIENAQDFSPFPEAVGKLSMRDYRVFDRANYVDGVFYSSTNVWLDQADPFLQDLLKREIPRAREAASSRTSTVKPGAQYAAAVIVAFAMASAWVLFLMVRASRRRANV